MKKAIVIGATSGLGRELALLLVQNGYRVGITGRRDYLLHELVNKNPGKFITYQQDMGILENPRMMNELVTQLGGLDLLVISAGTGGKNADCKFDIDKHMIDVNILGFTQVVDWAFHYFRKQQHGHIVAISSIAGMRGSRIAPAYNAAKAFQIRYLEGLRQQIMKNKLPLVITDIRPGFVDTAMANNEIKFWVSPVKKAVRQIFDAIQKEKKVAYVTHNWVIIAYFLKAIPRTIYERM